LKIKSRHIVKEIGILEMTLLLAIGGMLGLVGGVTLLVSGSHAVGVSILVFGVLDLFLAFKSRAPNSN
jgi:membrane associated rhomboid family serine protease